MTSDPRPRPAIPHAIPTLLALVLAIGACSGPATPSASTGPTASVAPSAAPSATTIDSPEAAAAAVLATDPRFAGLKRQDPNLIGGCCFYTVIPTATGYDLTIEIGWGDCPAGCIDRHHWFYSVATDGTVQLLSEDGPAVPAGVPGGGGDGTTGGVVGIRGVATAGPVCPVVRPNDPNCADRPVVGATIHIIDATGTEVAQLETDAKGAFVVTLPAGRYRVQADPVEGLMGDAQPADVTVGTALALVQLSFDTGIR
ncbi:MAG: carboxypeptidase regulatory-like domain-containing protein [Chloroflexi bacterium]|nr:carboxypeptidase regulatory-like domain-containing protein [Chloroflexota bacterium]